VQRQAAGERQHAEQQAPGRTPEIQQQPECEHAERGNDEALFGIATRFGQ
jgi:hypothetical protein